MKILLAITAIIVIAIIFLALKKLGNRKAPGSTIKAKEFLTHREQAMLNRLISSLPENLIFAQVSFGALLKATTQAERNKFDRKIADFVICDKTLKPMAVIELDDSSHAKKKQKDNDRDSMLRLAGYRVIRYSNVPDKEKLQFDFNTNQI
jgi:very-short-patch-repair endonuclease